MIIKYLFLKKLKVSCSECIHVGEIVSVFFSVPIA